MFPSRKKKTMHRVCIPAVALLLAAAGAVPCRAQLPSPSTQDPVLDSKPAPEPVARPADERRATGTLRFDNYQSERIGRYAATGLLRLHNPAGSGDLATGQFRSTVTGELAEGAAGYNVPLGPEGTRAGVIVGGGERVRGANDEGNGTYSRLTAGGTHPFLRERDRSLNGDLSFNHYEFHDELGPARPTINARHRFATARLRGDRQDAWLGGGRLSAYGEYQGGYVDRDTPTDPRQFEGYFARLRLRVERTQAITRESDLSVSLFAQGASRNLAPYRGFEFAGPHGVRAYPIGELSPDEGYFLRADYDWRLSRVSRWEPAVGIFWDTGHARLDAEPLPRARNNERTLSGAGVKFLLAQRGRLDAGVMVAWPTSGPSLRSGDRDPQVWLTAAAYF